MTQLPTNLTELQGDYAVFLPALSTFYVNAVGNAYHTAGSNQPAVLAERIPDVLGHGGIGMDYLKPDSLWS